MKFAVTSEQMKTAEYNADQSGLTYFQLMENAGQACFQCVEKIVGGIAEKTFVILCGRGNNGGDGITLAARIIEAGGLPVVIYAIDLPSSECARQAHSKYREIVPTALYTHNEDSVNKALDSCDVIVDCVFGTGFHGTLDEKLAKLIKYINENCHAKKISVDIPTGINADSGEIAENAFKPDFTIVLAAMKKGLLSQNCIDFCGHILTVEIGIPASAYTHVEAVFTPNSYLKKIPHLKKTAHKGDCGKILNIAGCSRYNGAAMLSSKAALRTGAGLVTLATPVRVVNAIASAIPEVTFLPLEQDDNGFVDEFAVSQINSIIKNYNVITIGCGLGKSTGSHAVVEYILKNAEVPVVLDADGLNCIAEAPEILTCCRNVTITPHPAELSRLSGIPVEDIQKNRIDSAKAFAHKYEVNVLLKGAQTVVASPTGKACINTSGNPSLAKAGSGDVLTGIIGALIALGMTPFDSAVLGALIHGLSADQFVKTYSPHGLLASDLCNIIPKIMNI